MFKSTVTAKLNNDELQKLNNLKTEYGFPEPNSITFKDFLLLILSTIQPLNGQPTETATQQEKQINSLQYALNQAEAEKLKLQQEIETLKQRLENQPPATPKPADEPAPTFLQSVTILFSKTDVFFINAMKGPYERRNNTSVTVADYVHSLVVGLYRYGKVHSNVVFTEKEIRDKERELTNGE